MADHADDTVELHRLAHKLMQGSAYLGLYCVMMPLRDVIKHIQVYEGLEDVVRNLRQRWAEVFRAGAVTLGIEWERRCFVTATVLESSTPLSQIEADVETILS